MARMPHRRLMPDGQYQALPIRSAFTNRTQRFRTKAHITPNKKRKGSDATIAKIWKRVKDAGVESAEALPQLKTGQIRRPMKKGKGVYLHGSRATSRGVLSSGQTSQSETGKRKLPENDEEDLGPSDFGLSTKRAKVRTTLAPQSSTSASSLSSSSSSSSLITSSKVHSKATSPFGHYRPRFAKTQFPSHEEERTSLTHERGEDSPESRSATDSDTDSQSSDSSEEGSTHLVPLFVSLENEQEAGIQAPPGEDNPRSVLQAIAAGSSLFGMIDIRYYPEDIARQVDEHGMIHDAVVDRGLYQVGVYPNWDPQAGALGDPSTEHDELDAPEEQ